MVCASTCFRKEGDSNAVVIIQLITVVELEVLRNE